MTLARLRLADQVHEALRARIMSRELTAGQRLSVPMLAAEFETSRSPVREAVQRLVAEGLAEEKPNRGAVVAGADLARLADMYEVRAPLDGLAARLATGHLTDDQVREMRRTLEAHARAFEAGDVDGIIRADMDFHGLIGRHCGNEDLWLTLEPIHERVTLAILRGEPAVWPGTALEEHRRIVAAIERRDPQEAGAAAQEHILSARGRILGKLATERARGTP